MKAIRCVVSKKTLQSSDYLPDKVCAIIVIEFLFIFEQYCNSYWLEPALLSKVICSVEKTFALLRFLLRPLKPYATFVLQNLDVAIAEHQRTPYLMQTYALMEELLNNAMQLRITLNAID